MSGRYGLYLQFSIKKVIQLKILIQNFHTKKSERRNNLLTDLVYMASLPSVGEFFVIVSERRCSVEQSRIKMMM